MSLRFGLNVIGECGDCTACCTVYHITALDKEAGVTCANLKDGEGCGVYPDRPKQCKRFECHWLKGLLDGAGGLGYRPDKLGLVFTMEFDGIISADKVVQGEELGNKAKRFFWELQKKRLVLFEGILYGPQKDIDQWLRNNPSLSRLIAIRSSQLAKS